MSCDFSAHNGDGSAGTAIYVAADGRRIVYIGRRAQGAHRCFIRGLSIDRQTVTGGNVNTFCCRKRYVVRKHETNVASYLYTTIESHIALNDVPTRIIRHSQSRDVRINGRVCGKVFRRIGAGRRVVIYIRDSGGIRRYRNRTSCRYVIRGIVWRAVIGGNGDGRRARLYGKDSAIVRDHCHRGIT